MGSRTALMRRITKHQMKNTEAKDFAVFPNPNRGSFRRLIKKEINTPSTYDLRGKIVYTYRKIQSQNVLAIQNLKKWMYIVESFPADKWVYYSKRIIQ